MKEKDKTEKQLAFELINKNILDVIGDAISIQDTDFRILYQNKAHKNIVGNRKGEFCYKAYQNKARVCKKCHLAMTFKDGKIHMLEQSRVTDKGIRHSENTAYPLRDSTGKIVAGMEMVRDVTQRNRAEEALIKEQKMAQDYLDIAGVMFVAINTNQNVTLINKKGCEILSCLDEEIIGKNWFDVFVPELIRAEVKDIFHKFVAGDISLLKYYENPVLTKNREERTIAWHNTVLRDEAGNITGTLSSGTDITDRKKAEEALEKAKDELEIKVKKRTAELERKNIALKEIIKHV
ncbi:MAG: PAS domain-containing protein, partial [Nitrospira sp.]|nr:PAS domain-containing protein [Nitrospira sp.]